MAYRNLVIDDIHYQYVIGKTFTKVKSGSKNILFENKKIGNPYGNGFVVTPLNVRLAIQGKGIPVFHCNRHNHTTSELVADCYDYEIYGKTTLVMNCQQCQEESWMNT